jgi:lauroyl/myristoyl acyltransferase
VHTQEVSRIIVAMPGGYDGTSSNGRPMILPRDLTLTAYLIVLLLPAWFLPDRWLTVPGRLIASATVRIRRGRTRRDVARLRDLFGDRLSTDATRLHTNILTHMHTNNVLYLRSMRPRGWIPALRVEGTEHIRRGAVIWTVPLVYDGLMTKMALCSVDASPGHLSHLYHFMSHTRFGVRFLNSLVRRAESRYITARFVMHPDNKTAALRDLRAYLGSGGVATITGVGGTGSRMDVVPLLAGSIELAVGAPQLARRSGGCLLAAATFREPDGSFVTRIEPVAIGSGRGHDEAVAFAEIIGRYLATHPDQCSPVLYR